MTDDNYIPTEEDHKTHSVTIVDGEQVWTEGDDRDPERQAKFKKGLNRPQKESE